MFKYIYVCVFNIVAQNLQNIIFNQIKATQMGSEIQDYADCKFMSNI